jgi:hypothetical protein
MMRALSSLLLFTASLWSASALACGACFAPVPAVPTDKLQVLQSAERILFVRDDKAKLSTVWVEIKYSGPADQFAWVLPLPKVPKVGIGASWLFDRLDLATAPRFQVVTLPSENCNSARSTGAACAASSRDVAFATSGKSAEGGGNSAGGGVTVLVRDQVGPYEYQVVQATKPEDGGAAMWQWLKDNNFQQPEAAKPILDSHVQKGDVFVAVKLKNNAGIDEIKPVSLTMDEAEPCVPLRLTSVAATDDLAVQMYIAGAGRAIPKNHLHVVVNPLKFDWFGGGGNYAQVLSQAIDEAAGRAFVTEFAGKLPESVSVADPTFVPQPFGGPAPVLTEPLVDYTRLSTAGLAQAKTACDVRDALEKTRFPIDSETATILEKATGIAKFLANGAEVKPAEVVMAYLLIEQLQGGVTPCDPGQKVDGAALAAELDEKFAKPIAQVAALLTAQPKFTRLVMKVSPKEMTKDPVFAWNPSLPDVARERKGQVASVCGGGDLTVTAQRLAVDELKSSHVIADTASGRTSSTPGSSALDLRWKSAPAALRVELLDETGPALPIAQADIDVVDAAIAGAHLGKASLPAGLTLKPAEVRWTPPANDPIVTSVAQSSDPGGCSSDRRTREPAVLAVLLAAVALALGVRRQRS